LQKTGWCSGADAVRGERGQRAEVSRTLVVLWEPRRLLCVGELGPPLEQRRLRGGVVGDHGCTRQAVCGGDANYSGLAAHSHTYGLRARLCHRRRRCAPSAPLTPLTRVQVPPAVSSPPVSPSALTFASSSSRLAKGASTPATPAPLTSPQRQSSLQEQDARQILGALRWSTRLQLLHRAADTCRQQDQILASRYVPRRAPFSAHSCSARLLGGCMYPLLLRLASNRVPKALP
jgi:hypothetical protein